jgi:hypothetical protein
VTAWAAAAAAGGVIVMDLPCLVGWAKRLYKSISKIGETLNINGRAAFCGSCPRNMSSLRGMAHGGKHAKIFMVLAANTKIHLPKMPF